MEGRGGGRNAEQREREATLRALIARHRPGDHLGTSVEIADRLCVSEMTARRDLMRLKREGLVESHRGGRGGWFVADGDLRHGLEALIADAEPGERIGTTPELAHRFEVHATTAGSALRRLRDEGRVVSLRGYGGGWYKPGARTGFARATLPPRPPSTRVAERRERLRRMIGPKRPGTKLPLQRLAARLGVSIDTVRRDLTALLPEELVGTRGKRGGWYRASGRWLDGSEPKPDP